MEDSAIISDGLIGQKQPLLVEALQRPDAGVPYQNGAIRENAHRVAAVFDRRLGIDNRMDALNGRCIRICLNHPGQLGTLEGDSVCPGSGKNTVRRRSIRRNKITKRIEAAREEAIPLTQAVIRKTCDDTAIREGAHIAKCWFRAYVPQLAKAIVEQRQMPLTVEQHDIAIWQCRKAKRIGDRVCPRVANIGDGRNEVSST